MPLHQHLQNVDAWQDIAGNGADDCTILFYFAFLSDEDEVHSQSLNPYVSAINQVHEDLGFPKPAIGGLMRRIRAGFASIEAERRGPSTQTEPLPAFVAAAILDLGFSATTDIYLIRDCTLIVLSYCFFSRGDSGVRATRPAIRIDADGLHLAEAAKNVSRLLPRLLRYPWPANSAGRAPHDLLRLFFTRSAAAWADRGYSPPAQLFRLPNDTLVPVVEHGVRESVLPARLMDAALTNVLPRLPHRPSPFGRWTKKSIRQGAASSALAIGVSLPRIMRWGIWLSLEAIQVYLDPLMPADPHAHLFFGHLLRAPDSAPLYVAHSNQTANSAGQEAR